MESKEQTDRTICNNKVDTVICDNENNMYVNVAISREGNVIKKGTVNIMKYKDLTIEIQRMWNVKIRDNSNKNNFQIIQKIPEQHTEKAGNQGTTEYSQPYWALHAHCGSANVNVQTFSMGSSITCSINCKHRTAATLFTLKTWFVLGI